MATSQDSCFFFGLFGWCLCGGRPAGRRNNRTMLMMIVPPNAAPSQQNAALDPKFSSSVGSSRSQDSWDVEVRLSLKQTNFKREVGAFSGKKYTESRLNPRI